MSKLLTDVQKMFLDLDTGDIFLSNNNLSSPVIGYLHTQAQESDHWKILHQEGTDIVIIDVLEKNIDNTYSKIKPNLVKIIDVNSVEVFFSKKLSGIANLLLIRMANQVLPIEITPTITPTISLTPSITKTASITTTPTNTVTPSITNTNTPTNTPTPTVTRTPSMTVTPSLTTTNTPTFIPAGTPTPTATSTVTPSVTISMSTTQTPTPTVTPSLQILTSVKFANSGSNNGGLGFNWTNPNNISLDDDIVTSINPSNVATNNAFLRANNFQFNLPDIATILGIEVTYNRFASTTGGNNILDDTVQLVINGVRSGNNLSTGSVWSLSGSTLKVFGGPNELWGLAFTPLDVNSNNFGVDIRVDTTGTRIANVDYVNIKIYYSV